eukprot:scaffold8178_cov296-Pinguiococcus_pyrenoidosus.AAC.10
MTNGAVEDGRVFFEWMKRRCRLQSAADAGSSAKLDMHLDMQHLTRAVRIGAHRVVISVREVAKEATIRGTRTGQTKPTLKATPRQPVKAGLTYIPNAGHAPDKFWKHLAGLDKAQMVQIPRPVGRALRRVSAGCVDQISRPQAMRFGERLGERLPRCQAWEAGQAGLANAADSLPFCVRLYDPEQGATHELQVAIQDLQEVGLIQNVNDLRRAELARFIVRNANSIFEVALSDTRGGKSFAVRGAGPAESSEI